MRASFEPTSAIIDSTVSDLEIPGSGTYDDGAESSQGTSTIDPTKKPKTIDLTPTVGDDKGQQYLGIYEVGENTRRLCFSLAGKPRPTEFASPDGSEHFLVTFERVKAK